MLDVIFTTPIQDLAGLPSSPQRYTMFIWFLMTSRATLLVCFAFLLCLQAFGIYCNLEMMHVLPNFLLLNHKAMFRLLATRINTITHSVTCSKLFYWSLLIPCTGSNSLQI
ncbi:hypothetical protein CFC21_108900 [Triticum aestivum]|uniref:Uncharacterized protein n=3 Tax=Triticinae TaxID=1648030 RepID=A0A3B6TQD2_WHEAT|nr:hypothetical protein CFC21_108900 [Triticum aestivum]